MRIYLAGPLFTQAERAWNALLADGLRAAGHEVFLPQAEEPAAPTPVALYENNVRGLRDAEVVVAILDGPDPDSGTSWECGYAAGIGTPVVTVRTDFRRAGDDPAADLNLMLSQSAAANLAAPSLEWDVPRTVAAIVAELAELQ
ncbi:MAG: nucleoside 2-deoxyribosyltransferase [Dehalococcoidia bacterium]